MKHVISAVEPRRAFEHLPHCPPPEVDVKVLQYIFRAVVSRLFEIVGKRATAFETVAAFDPSTLPFSFVIIWWVSDADLNIKC